MVCALTVGSNEHQRRSPDCSFFQLCNSVKPKLARSRKSRTSKASRLSTQSNMTTLSEGMSGTEADVNVDDTILSIVQASIPDQPSKKAKKVPKSKKGTAGKGRKKQVKQQEDISKLNSSFLEPEDDDFEVKTAPSPSAIPNNNKKRNSKGISNDEDNPSIAESRSDQIEPQIPIKRRRTTRASSAIAPTPEVSVMTLFGDKEPDEQLSEIENTTGSSAPAPKKKGETGRKRPSTRKASAIHNASKASLRAAVPNDEDIDAALEAELDRPLTDDEGTTESVSVEQPKGRRLTRNKRGPTKATASIAPTRRETRSSAFSNADTPGEDQLSDVREIVTVEIAAAPKDVAEALRAPILSTVEESSGKVPRQISSQQKAPTEKMPEEPIVETSEGEVQEDRQNTGPQHPGKGEASREFPTVMIQPVSMATTNESDASVQEIEQPAITSQGYADDDDDRKSLEKESRPRVPSKKAPGVTKKGKGKKKPPPPSSTTNIALPEVMNGAQADKRDDEVSVALGNMDARESDVTIVEKEEAVGAPQATKPSKAKGRPRKAKAAARNDSIEAPLQQPDVTDKIEDTPHPPPGQSTQSTPHAKLSPQSSDAENQPPSSRRSFQQPSHVVLSPSKPQDARIPLSLSTPTASPQRMNSKLQSTIPWTAIDLEQIFQNTPSADKEDEPFAIGITNKREGLSSPEKKLNVEEWIRFNAHRGEEKLRNECERVVGKFESEGVRALRTLEGIVCPI